MFRVEPDGSAIVFHIPVSPFVPLQHNTIDVSTVNRLANFGVRFALEHGWCRLRPSDSNELRPSEDITVFFAGVDAELNDLVPKFGGGMTPASMFFSGQFWVSYIGTSSYGMHGKLYHYDAGNEEQKMPLGSFSVTCVVIAPSTRRPAPIPEKRAALLREMKQMHNVLTELPVAKRINAAEIIQRSGLFTDDKCTQLVETLPTCAAVAPLKVVHRRTFEIRETDIDFNKHVNQVVMIQLVINAFRSALADQTTIFPRLLDAAVEPLVGDLLLRGLRIDYIREVPMDHTGVAVTLFFSDDASRDAIIASFKDCRKNVLVELWFIVQGYPGDGGAPFISSIGRVLVYC